MSDLADVQAKLEGTLSLDEGGRKTIANLFAIVIVHRKTAADGMASTATANTLVWTNPFTTPVRLRRLVITPGSTLTADASNFATITIKTDDAAAGTPAIALTVTTELAAAANGTGNWATSVPISRQISGDDATVAVGAAAAEVDVVAGGSVWFNIAKTGTGVVVPVSDYTLVVEKL